MPTEPGHSKDHTLLAKSGDSEEDPLGVLLVCHDHIDDFSDTAGFVERSVDIVDRDRLGELASRQLVVSDEVLVDEISGGASVNHAFGRRLF